ncbi:unnamed protein product [Dicrocoelium dendriticum]|nr:unnamed protein product [Dicrocoelium dendriticum]
MRFKTGARGLQNTRATSAWDAYYSITCRTVTTVFMLSLLSGLGLYSTRQAKRTPETPKPTQKVPLRCFVCNNYASVETGVRPGPSSGLAWLDGKPVIGGLSKQSSNDINTVDGLTAVQTAKLCSEHVDRTKMTALIDSKDYGVCPNVNYNGCAKIVTKSFRVRPQVGKAMLAAVVVSRVCAVIPEAMGVGCFQTAGGAGMRRTVCYCEGNFCNTSNIITPVPFTFIIMCTLLLFAYR